jgi:hypothetical protein
MAKSFNFSSVSMPGITLTALRILSMGGNMCGPCPYTHIATPDDSLFYPFSDWFTYDNLSQIVNHGREYLLIEQINHYSFTCAARFCLIDMLTGIDR